MQKRPKSKIVRTRHYNCAYDRCIVAQPCVNGDRLSQAKFDPSQIRNPQPIDIKFETDDYVRPHRGQPPCRGGGALHR